MACTVRRAKDFLFQIELVGEAPNCHPLPMSPNHREPELATGSWVIVSVALWSGPDRACIQVALNAVRNLVGSIELGLRMFNDFSEFDTWYPELTNRTTSPVWVFIKEGILMGHHSGLLNETQLQAMIESHLAPVLSNRDS